MSQIITLKILRWSAGMKAPYFQSYQVPSSRPTTVLELLGYIYENLDGTLAFRNHDCHLGSCQACLVRVDGKAVRACVKRLMPGDSADITPHQPQRIIRDLVCRPYDRD